MPAPARELFRESQPIFCTAACVGVLRILLFAIFPVSITLCKEYSYHMSVQKFSAKRVPRLWTNINFIHFYYFYINRREITGQVSLFIV